LLLETGAIPITSEEELYMRASLLFDELDMGGEHLRQFKEAIQQDATSARLAEWLSAAIRTTVAIPLIRRFSVIEGNTADPGERGLGRVSPDAFPRLGGVLHKEAGTAGVPSSQIVAAVERTCQASYLAALFVVQGLASEPRLDGEAEIWDRWIPAAYVMPGTTMAAVDGVCAFMEFWKRTLDRLGMQEASKELTGLSSRVGMSVVGLSGVGAALAFAERRADSVPTRATQSAVSCWRCKTSLKVTDQTRGKKVRCPSCGMKQAMPI
jgi:hypothetical protein